MTREELKDFFKVLKAIYTSDRFLPDSAAMAVWASMLEDLDYQVAILAAKKYIATERFPPTVADIRRISSEIVDGERSIWSDGWKEVLSAIRRFGVYGEAEALAFFSPVTRRAVEGIGFKEICTSEDIDVVRGQFRMAFEQIAKREYERAQLPESVRAVIGEMNFMAIGGGEGE